MEEQELARMREEEEKKLEEERQRILELEKPDPDPLYGWRIHSWVLILPGKRDLTESFFIEPASGLMYDLSDINYLGIESIWNHVNYWVNMQICTNGCQDLNLDLTNIECWEHLLAGEPWDQRVIAKDVFSFPEEKDYILQEKHLDMPSSWVAQIELPHSKYEQRYPNGSKVIEYNRTRCDLYAPYLHRDGLIWRIMSYKDYERMFPETIFESYMYREDCLVKKVRHINKKESSVEYYKRGRDDSMKVFKSFYINETQSMQREIDFYSEARYDGLKRLEMGPDHMLEEFKDREDRLYFRYVQMEPNTMAEGPRRSVKYVTEKFERNPNIPADEDVASREFCMETKEIILKYHYAQEKLTSAMRKITKPPIAELGDRLTYNPAFFTVYKPDPFAKEDHKADLFLLMVKSLQDEEETLQHVRGMEDELFNMIRSRALEVAQAHLIISIFDEERNEEAKKGMKELERAMKERSDREVEAEIDFLAPYLTGQENEVLPYDVAVVVRDKCLEDYKEMLVNRANRIQHTFEKTSNQLIEEEKLFEIAVEKTSVHDVDDSYMDRIRNLLFYMNTLEKRLDRQKEMAPRRYKALEECLRHDFRLSALYANS